MKTSPQSVAPLSVLSPHGCYRLHLLMLFTLLFH